MDSSLSRSPVLLYKPTITSPRDTPPYPSIASASAPLRSPALTASWRFRRERRDHGLPSRSSRSPPSPCPRRGHRTGSPTSSPRRRRRQEWDEGCAPVRSDGPPAAGGAVIAPSVGRPRGRGSSPQGRAKARAGIRDGGAQLQVPNPEVRRSGRGSAVMTRGGRRGRPVMAPPPT